MKKTSRANSTSTSKRSNSNDKPRNSNRWTEARFRGFITSILRGGMRRWAPKYDTLKAALVGKKLNKKSGRQANHYLCALCGKEVVASQVQIDHKEPIGSCKTWDEFIEKLYCETSNLQVACKKCHKIKTKEERDESKKDAGNT